MDPHYKLLDKAGIVTTKAKGYNSLIVVLNPAGEKLFSGIEGVQKSTNPDKTVSYVVPLAERKLVAVNNVTMIKPHLAQVQYTWKWAPNRLGQDFDASGSLVKSFGTWDRATLIKSYGVDFYGAAADQGHHRSAGRQRRKLEAIHGVANTAASVLLGSVGRFIDYQEEEASASSFLFESGSAR